jgi:RimJ/RimL family protein N-acetyltransferase
MNKTTTEPLLEDVPERLETARLIVRMPQGSDAPAHNAAVCESLDDLGTYMPWAQAAPSFEQSHADCRRLQAKFLLREDMSMFMFARDAEGREGEFVGGVGLHRIDWAVRRFELGYWCRVSRQGQGLVVEAARALTALAFDQLRARRVEVRMADANERSWRVAERLGFALEGVLRSNVLDPRGEAHDTRIYALTRAVG